VCASRAAAEAASAATDAYGSCCPGPCCCLPWRVALSWLRGEVGGLSALPEKAPSDVRNVKCSIIFCIVHPTGNPSQRRRSEGLLERGVDCRVEENAKARDERCWTGANEQARVLCL
jgi:hypothetical protein